MNFIEFTFALGLLIYAVRHNLWLDAPWIKDNHSQPVDIKPTEQQNKVFDAWVQDQKKPVKVAALRTNEINLYVNYNKK